LIAVPLPFSHLNRITGLILDPVLEENKVCLTLVALPFTLLKSIFKAKEELPKLKYFIRRKHNLQKIL
jgi:hypothetical protein